MFFAIHKKPTHLLLEFHAPESSNALSLEAARELGRIVKTHREPVVVVRSKHRRVFCSGGNLADYARLKGKAPGLKINREITRHLDAFARWPAIKLAVIEGDVLGGGMEWLARFDFRWSLPHVLFGFWQKRIGLSPGWGGGRAWAGLIGEATVRRLLLEAKLLSAAHARELGLIDRLVTDWKLDEEIEAWSADMKGLSTQALRSWSTKRESAVMQKRWHSTEHLEALRSWRRR